MWVRSEYAGELAVLSAWLCALIPWSVSYASSGDGRLFRIHFPYVFFQFFDGREVALEEYVFVWEAAGYASEADTAFGYRLWLIAAVVFALALVLSVLYYRYETDLEERSPVDPVRAMGGLLVGTAMPLTAATVLLRVGPNSVTVPVGVVFLYVFGVLLLVVERT